MIVSIRNAKLAALAQSRTQKRLIGFVPAMRRAGEAQVG
jgi:hypothetical protein